MIRWRVPRLGWPNKETIELWANVVAVIGFPLVLIATITGLVSLSIQIHNVGTEVNSAKQSIESLKELTKAPQFRITYPNDSGIVELTDIVKGITPYSDKNHYIVVTPTETGDDWVQEGPITIYTGGLWTARAKFGTATIGAGKQFVVRAIATNSTLSPGHLTEVPEDAIFSESIVITRKKTNESS